MKTAKITYASHGLKAPSTTVLTGQDVRVREEGSYTVVEAGASERGPASFVPSALFQVRTTYVLTVELGDAE